MGEGVARGRGVCVPGETKALSTRTLCQAWRPAVEELAPLQQASGNLHEVAWAGCPDSEAGSWERVNVTFRRIHSCCSLPSSEVMGGVLVANLRAEFIRCCCESCGERRFWVFSGCSERFCAYGVRGGEGTQALSLHPHLYRVGLRKCAYRRTRPLGGGRRGHHLRDLRGVHWCAQKFARYFLVNGSNSISKMTHMQALAGQPSLHGYYACMVCWVKEAPRRNCRQNICETSFSPVRVFSVSSKLSIQVLGADALAFMDRQGSTS